MSRWGRAKVTCSYCYGTGHNKRGCETYKRDAQEGRVPKFREIKKRRCSYCGTADHDRRSCESLHDDKISTILANREWIRLVVGDLEKSGVGIGTLIKYSPRGVGRGWILGMVTGFRWKNLSINYPTKAWIQIRNFGGNTPENLMPPGYSPREVGYISLRDIHRPVLADRQGTPVAARVLKPNIKLEGSIAESEVFKIVSPVCSNLTNQAPQNILAGGDGIGEFYEGKRSKDYYVNFEKD